MLLLVERVFLGPMRNAKNAGLLDLSVREWVVMLPLVLLIGWMGLVPQPFLAPARGSVDQLLTRFAAAEQRLHDADPSRAPATGADAPALATGVRLCPPAARE
jgi:NADH-quinone oxidoreductase subunit M